MRLQVSARILTADGEFARTPNGWWRLSRAADSRLKQHRRGGPGRHYFRAGGMPALVTLGRAALQPAWLRKCLAPNPFRHQVKASTAENIPQLPKISELTSRPDAKSQDDCQ